jgi:hypothetical protein
MTERWIDTIRADVDEWCRERKDWMLRALLLVYLAYAGLRHFFDATYRSLFSPITLGFHEAGHLLFSWFGQTLGIAGGSVMQIAVPLAAAFYLLLKQRDYFGLVVGLSWLAFAVWEMATYMGDARSRLLPLVGFGPDPIHDWTYLFSKFGLLKHDTRIAALTRVLAFLIWVLSMLLGGWLCARIRMERRRPRARGTTRR